MGLVPIGADPDSGLWEFWHVQSGAEPIRGADGRLTLAEDSGLVLVLLDGGTFWMGSQDVDPAGTNYDAEGEPVEQPPRSVRLPAFFLSKYEVTQAQWKSLTGRNPSRYGPDGEYYAAWNAAGRAGSLLHPVEQVTWNESWRWVAQAGLTLPTEAQWEYGARAGSAAAWWTGGEKTSVDGAANLADRFAQRTGAQASWLIEEWLDDGFTVHAPVGSFMANAFGVHDTMGNVFEWCADGYDSTAYTGEVLDHPWRPYPDLPNRVLRGGSFGSAATYARSANRDDYAPTSADNDLGLRPARRVVGP